MKVKDLIWILNNIEDKEIDIRVIDTNGNILEEQGADIEDIIEIIQHDSEGNVVYAILRTN